ncbi:hypothetical protein B0T10DRAFT_481564 [Thelonectria olida]|uniref:DUF1857-domain-containing protein n=1 Tax=Thelonectria olida TaxID=1576542 RepID=A0A9P8W7K3_9HYPO|nr:hypothetical protein B0T10DRAFT_481564 [Thelonectria olida]
MVVINIAYTAPINPPGIPSVLSQDQVWAGLKLKAIRPQEFVPAIIACKVLHQEPFDSGDKIERLVTFASDAKLKEDADPVKEICYQYNSNLVVYHQGDGSTIYNMISTGQDGGLHLTYSFEWRHPEIPEGSEEAKMLGENHWRVARIAVENSILTFRRLVNDGEIK